MVRLSKHVTMMPGIIGSDGRGRCALASGMNFSTHDSDSSAPFITNEMVSWNERLTRLASQEMLIAAVSSGTLWIDCARQMLTRMLSSWFRL